MRGPNKRPLWMCLIHEAALHEFSSKNTSAGHRRLPLGSICVITCTTLNIMIQAWFSPHMVFVSLLLIAVHSDALPSTPSNQDSLVMSNSSTNAVMAHCYTPDSQDTPGIEPVGLTSCRNALAVLVQTPEFTTRFYFSRNPSKISRHLALKLPVGWQLGDDAVCRIVINCLNAEDTAVFRFADVAQGAKRIIENCVDRPDPYGRFPLLNWGGVERIGGEEDFYVAVARPLRAGRTVELVNETVVTSRGPVDEAARYL